jgi:hypothetical protein
LSQIPREKHVPKIPREKHVPKINEAEASVAQE